MITEAQIRDDGLFIKGFRPQGKKGKIIVYIEQVSPESTLSGKGFLSHFADKNRRKLEKNAWKRQVKDE